MNLSQMMQAVALAAVVLVCIWAFLRGGPAEKGGAACLLPAWVLSLLFHQIGQGGPGAIVIGIDILLAIAFIVLLIRYRKVWLIVSTAFQINVVIAHFIGVSQNVGGWSYFTIINIWGGYGLLIALAAGVFFHQRSARRVRN